MQINKKHFFLIVLILILSFGLYKVFIYKPKYINQLKQQFGLVVNKKTVVLIYEKEEWLPNGDGYYFAEIAFNNNSDVKQLLSQRKFRELPIEEYVPISDFNNKLKEYEQGHYLLEIDKVKKTDFRIVLLDMTKNRLIIFYQYM